MIRKLVSKVISKHKDSPTGKELFNYDFAQDGEIHEISHQIIVNKTRLENNFKHSTDLVFYEFSIISGSKGLIVYIDGLINRDIINRDIISPLIAISEEKPSTVSLANFPSIVSAVNSKTSSKMGEIINEIVEGNAILFIEKEKEALIIDCKGWQNRSIETPDTEAVTRGPREGFVENIRTNTSMLRRKIKNPNLVFENFVIGKQTRTNTSLAYVDGIVHQRVLQEVRRKLDGIHIDAVLESGYIEQLMEDNPFSLFPTAGNSQKPDVIAAKILEGRVAIFCDGSPHVLTVPHVFLEVMQSNEDYYWRPYWATIMRGVRILAILISVFLPALYVALQTFHQEMIPSVLIISMAASREGIPFPALAEALLMTFMFELLRESGTRLPRAVGSAISIVGALVIGDAAVSAGIVSAPMVIVIAMTAVAGFVIPALNEAIIFLRILFLLLAGFLGLYGITCGLFFIAVHLISLNSCGIPYTSSFAPLNLGDLKDAGLRVPFFFMKNRPYFIAGLNKKRV